MGTRPREGPSRAERSFLSHLAPAPDAAVVDLCCGHGDMAVAVAALAPRGHVTLLTDDAATRSAAEQRLRAAGVRNATVLVAASAGELPSAHFDLAYLAVPPYLSNTRLADLLMGARRCLRPGGRLVLFAGMRQGAPTVLRRAEEIFGNLQVLDKPGGTRIARCYLSPDAAETAGAQAGGPEPEAEHGAPFTVRIRGEEYSFLSGADVFSHGALDEGTRLLLESVEIRPSDRVADVGCGYGAIGIVAARLAPRGRVTLVDTNARAVALARRNIALNGIPNAEALVSDGLSALGERRFDLVLSNPPLHAAPGTLEQLTAQAHARLAPGGRLAYVVHKAYDARPIVAAVFGAVTALAETDAFRVIGAGRVAYPCLEG